MNIPSTEDEEIVFEDWCLENDLHPLEVTCGDPEHMWVLVLSRYGNGSGGYDHGWGDGYGDGDGSGFGSGFGECADGFGDGFGDGVQWVTR